MIHVFAGAETGRHNWVFVDLELGAGFNLHNVNMWSYLCSLARSGKVKAIIGGPPCRTTSRLRSRGLPGPRKVRGRGEDRWGLEGIWSRTRAGSWQLGAGGQTGGIMAPG